MTRSEIHLLFQDASVRMEKFLGSSTSDIEKFMALGDKAQVVTLVNLKKDEDYDDAPDEFIGNALHSSLLKCSPQKSAKYIKVKCPKTGHSGIQICATFSCNLGKSAP